MARYRSQAPLAASRWNALKEQAIRMAEDYQEMLVDMLLVEGLPPFTERLSESEEYHQLVTASLSGDPRYHNDKTAKARLAELSLRYGPPPDYPIPIGQLIPNRPGAEAAAMP